MLDFSLLVHTPVVHFPSPLPSSLPEVLPCLQPTCRGTSGQSLGNFRDVNFICEISGFRRGVVEVFALLRCYAAWVGSWLPTFRDNLLVPSSRVKKSHSSRTVRRNIPEERRLQVNFLFSHIIVNVALVSLLLLSSHFPRGYRTWALVPVHLRLRIYA